MRENDNFFPDDDGRMKRAWVRGAEERGLSACERVYDVLKDRKWVKGKIVVTETNSQEDVDGYDLFVPMDMDLVQTLGIKPQKLGVPVQVKSSDHSVKDFLREHRVTRNGKLAVKNGEYIFTFNGHNSKDIIVADLVGQMIVLSREVMSEENFLMLLASVYGDDDAVLRWCENREIIKDFCWYKDLLS